VAEIGSGEEVEFFQGATVKLGNVASPSSSALPTVVESQDGLRLVLESAGAFVQRPAAAFNRAEGIRGGFLLRDVAADSGFFAINGTNCDELGLKVQAQFTGATNHIAVEGRLIDMTAKDRAVTLVFALGLNARGWQWGDDIRHHRTIAGPGEFTRQVSVKCGATGTESLYPIAPIWLGDSGLALALDMHCPAVFRVGYHAGLKQLFIAYDFALVQETKKFPSSADFRFVLFHFPGPGGFRAAWDKFTQIFPDQFAVRSKEQGLWMPFTDVSTVKSWEDFGFRYHEGNNAVSWDDAHGILSFRYTEPMTWWMPMSKDVPRTLAEALRVRDELAKGPESFRRKMARVSRLAAMQDETGEPALLFRNTPWANGAVWSLNPNPWLLLTDGTGNPSAPGEDQTSSASSLNAATVYWNEAVKQQLYGVAAKGQLDGEYLDSLEGYVTADLNFRREHFRFTTVPLTFSTETAQPALFKGLAVFEFARWLAEDVHRMGKLMFANGVPYRFPYLCPWLDVLGTETDWLVAGEYRPVSVETMDVWRTLSGAKPYLLLMNTDYDAFTPDRVEKYFQRALFYGMWPGFFSHNASENPYWQNPRWYDRDRPLFKKYIPLIRRVAEAGWTPVTRATCDNANLLLERFGAFGSTNSVLTLFNPSSSAQSGTVTLDAADAQGTQPPNPLLGARPEAIGHGWRLSLRPGETSVWEL
jgi:hypothetical protein